MPMLNKCYFPVTVFRNLIRIELLILILIYFFFPPGSARWAAAKGFSRGRWSAKPATTPPQNARVKNLKLSSYASWPHVQVRARFIYTTFAHAWALAPMAYSCCTTCCRTLPNITGNNPAQTAFDRLFLNDESHYTRNCVDISALTYYRLFLMDNLIQIPEHNVSFVDQKQQNKYIFVLFYVLLYFYWSLKMWALLLEASKFLHGFIWVFL